MAEQTVWVWSVLGTALGTLLLAAAILWASKLFTQQARDLWRAVRGHRADVIAAVDETTDPVIARLAGLAPVPAEVWAAFLPAFLAALADGLDRALAEPGGDHAG